MLPASWWCCRCIPAWSWTSASTRFCWRPHQIDYSFVRIKGLTNILFGGQGMFMDRFVTTGSPGLLILHGYGNVFERRLAAGESIMVEPGAFLYKDSSVTMEVEFQKLGTGFFGGHEDEPGAHDRTGARRHSIDVRASPHRIRRPPCSAPIAARQLREGSAFCGNCGSPVKAPQAATPASTGAGISGSAELRSAGAAGILAAGRGAERFSGRASRVRAGRRRIADPGTPWDDPGTPAHGPGRCAWCGAAFDVGADQLSELRRDA